MNIFVKLLSIIIFVTLCACSGSGSLYAAGNNSTKETYDHRHEDSNNGEFASKIKAKDELEITNTNTDKLEISHSKNLGKPANVKNTSTPQLSKKDLAISNIEVAEEEILIRPKLKPTLELRPIIFIESKKNPDISVAPKVSKISPLWNKLNTHLRYKAVWKGMKVGELDATIGFESDNIYDFTANMSAAGLVGAIVKYKTTTKAKVRLTANDDLKPTIYDHYRTRKKDGKTHVHIQYDDNGKEIKYFMNPPERKDKRPLISAHNRNNVHTIPSMVLNAWKSVIEAHLEAKAADNKNLNKVFTYDFFEGRRKARGIFTTKGYDSKGNINVVVTLEPLGGFNEKDMRKYNKDGYEVTVLIDPVSYKPLTIKGISNLGNAQAKLIE